MTGSDVPVPKKPRGRSAGAGWCPRWGGEIPPGLPGFYGPFYGVSRQTGFSDWRQEASFGRQPCGFGKDQSYAPGAWRNGFVCLNQSLSSRFLKLWPILQEPSMLFSVIGYLQAWRPRLPMPAAIDGNAAESGSGEAAGSISQGHQACRRVFHAERSITTTPRLATGPTAAALVEPHCGRNFQPDARALHEIPVRGP